MCNVSEVVFTYCVTKCVLVTTGYRGTDCSELCPEGTFGEDCAQRCNCKNGAKCSSENGRCNCTAGEPTPNFVCFSQSSACCTIHSWPKRGYTSLYCSIFLSYKFLPTLSPQHFFTFWQEVCCSLTEQFKFSTVIVLIIHILKFRCMKLSLYCLLVWWGWSSFFLSCITLTDGLGWGIVHIATVLRVGWFTAWTHVGGGIFHIYSDWPWSPPLPLFSVYQVFSGGKVARVWLWPPTASSS
jgi:hypothetical protein